MAITVLHDVLWTGVQEGASDWHLCEGRNAVLRISGQLVELAFSIDGGVFDQFIEETMSRRLKTIFEETGDADFAFEEDGTGRFRANLHRQRGLRGLTLRHVKSVIPSSSTLGLPPTIPKLAESRNGIIFVTGTTGSGKSTTLGAMVEHLNSLVPKHIITIEDPIEYAFADKRCVIEQREVGLDANTFESALVHALRQDPDIMVIGEMRSRDTFETALAAAETGHLVMTTLHTKDAAQSIHRILDMYPHAQREAVCKSLGDTLRAIICQRLIARAAGSGVRPAVEIMVNTPTVRRLLREMQLEKLPQAIVAGREDGMLSLNQHLLDLVNEGEITEEVALDASDSPKALEMNLRGIFLSAEGGIIG